MGIEDRISDAYIEEIIKSSGAFNPALNKTQGIKLRELVKKNTQ